MVRDEVTLPSTRSVGKFPPLFSRSLAVAELNSTKGINELVSVAELFAPAGSVTPAGTVMVAVFTKGSENAANAENEFRNSTAINRHDLIGKNFRISQNKSLCAVRCFKRYSFNHCVYPINNNIQTKAPVYDLAIK